MKATAILLFLIAASALGQSDADLLDRYKLPLLGYVTSVSSQQRGVKASRTQTTPTENVYTDERARFIVSVDARSIGLILQNTTDSSARVLWDEASYVDGSETSHRILHGGTKLVDRQAAQPPSIVPPGAKLEDTLYPVENVLWRNGTWMLVPLFDNHALGETLRILLPVDFGGETYEYLFTFVLRPDQRAANQLRQLAKITVGQRREQILSLLGEPDAREVPNSDKSVEIWEYRAYRPGFTKISFTNGVVSDVNRNP